MPRAPIPFACHRERRPPLARRRAGALAALLLPAALAGCGEGAPPPRSAPKPAAVVAAPAAPPALVLPGGKRAAEVHMMPGLEGVIGVTAAQLVAAFGPARLDVREGDARKLQFAGAACVLDVYLYPDVFAGPEPRATYVDARRPENGADVDRATCVAALRQTAAGGGARP